MSILNRRQRLAVTIALIAMVAADVQADTHQNHRSDVAAPELPTPLTLEWCLERARAANATLAMSAANADAQRHLTDSIGALDDPRFSYEASNIPTGDFDFDSTPLSGHQLRLQQKLPLPGLLSKRERAAQRGAEAADLLVDDERLSIDGLVESSWAELGFAQQAREITLRNIELLRQLAATAESRYRVGDGLQQDVLRAQVELTALLRERFVRVEAIERASSRLVTLLDLPPNTVFPTTALDSSTGSVPTLSSVLETVSQVSPRLKSAERHVEQARLQIEIAKAEGLPDIDVGVGYRVRNNVVGDPVEGDDFVSAGFTIRMPVNRSKWNARVSESTAELRNAEAKLRGLRVMLGSHTRRAHAGLVRASSEEELLDTGLVPLAVQSLEASRSAYRVGRIDFSNLLDSQVRLLEAELRLARARADKRLAYAALESAAGKKLR